MMISSSYNRRRIIGTIGRQVWLRQHQRRSTATKVSTGTKRMLPNHLHSNLRTKNFVLFATCALAVSVSSAITFEHHQLTKHIQHHDVLDDETDTAKARIPSTLFPQLDIQLLPTSSSTSSPENESTTATLFPNSIEPIEFETSMFEGKVLLQLPSSSQTGGDDATEDEDISDKDSAMSKKNNKYLDIQIQGKFKQPPKGTVYFGVQLVDKERMSNLAGWKKGLATLLLKTIQTFAPVLYSYGSDNEYPYIVSPLAYNAETYLSTSPGETIPKLGPSLQDGRNIPEGSTFNTQDTYTFKFTSKCLDLLEWQLRLGSHTINLERFWGKSSVRLVAYDSHEPLTDSSDTTLVFCAQVQPFHERVQNSK